jgi:hypothetical protein
MKTVGVINIDPWFVLDDTDSLLNDLVYFDKLVYTIGSRDALRNFCLSLPKGAKDYESKLKELETLENAGLISEYKKEQFQFDQKLLLDNKVVSYSIKALELSSKFTTKDRGFNETFVDFLERFREVGQLNSRVNAILLNNRTSDNYIPVIRSSYYNFSTEELYSTSTVLSVVIRKFPFVSEHFDLNKFIDFKSDDDTQLKVQRLRDWVIDISKKNYSTKEIEQKIDYLLNEYCKQLEIHKLKYELGTMETFVTTSLEVIENIAKINFSKAAKVIFELGKQDLNLLEAEQKMVGKEVAIIQKAKEATK